MRAVNLTDHEFARHLRKRGAIDNYEHAGNTVRWSNGKGELVAVGVYDNANNSRVLYVDK